MLFFVILIHLWLPRWWPRTYLVSDFGPRAWEILAIKPLPNNINTKLWVTLNYRRIVGRYPKPNGVVCGLILRCRVFSLLDPRNKKEPLICFFSPLQKSPIPRCTKATSHTRVKARDHCNLSALIGRKGGDCPNSLHTRRWRPKSPKNTSWIKKSTWSPTWQTMNKVS